MTRNHQHATRRCLAGLWFLLVVLGLIYVTRYALTNPYVDEWAFMPILLKAEPALPWLWELHNEHRFPLPRALYLALFWISGDLRTACFLSLLGVSLLALLLMRQAGTIRGHASYSDAIFPFLLMHTGQGENLYMGYQLCFMLTTVLAGLLILVMVSGETLTRPVRAAWAAIVIGWLLLGCGAAGLVYGTVACLWGVWLTLRCSSGTWPRVLIVLLSLATPTYIVLYLQGYVRPEHHPPSSGVWESIRIGCQAQTMVLGPAAAGLWPVAAFLVLLAGMATLAVLTRHAWRDCRAAGLLLIIIAGAGVAFGIGWGRSGMLDDRGFAWRYGWLVFPPVAAAWFGWLLWPDRWSRPGLALGGILAAVLFPVNEVSGFLNGETVVRRRDQALEADVRAGRSADEVVRRHFGDGVDPRIASAMRLMRDRHYTYYGLLGKDAP